jgi:hypothetical protein
VILYVASIGQSAAKHRRYFRDAKRYFNFDESIYFVCEQLKDEIIPYLDKNSNLVVVKHPFSGNGDYLSLVKELVKQVLDILKFYEKHGQCLDEIIVNTAGGTEKMSLIIKDAVDVIKKIFPYVTQVWGGNVGYETTYTRKPNIDIEEFVNSFYPGRKQIEFTYSIPENEFETVQKITEFCCGEQPKSLWQRLCDYCGSYWKKIYRVSDGGIQWWE